jgi:hypothetical protein
MHGGMLTWMMQDMSRYSDVADVADGCELVC